jgi:hypothetical protein
VALVLVAPACSPADSPQAVQAAGEAGSAAVAADDMREGTLLHLEGRHGKPDELWIQASYKVKREAGKLSKALSIEIEDAPPGVTHALSLDGFELAKLVTSSKGKAEFELTNNFPTGFEEPAEGSLIEVGGLAEIRLQTLHELADLQVEIDGPGKLVGKIGYKVERLGETVTTEFEVKVAQAGAKALHAVRVDGVHVGDLSVDAGGKGKLVYSTLGGEPFPPGFKAPHAGSTIEIGQLYKGALEDDLEAGE